MIKKNKMGWIALIVFMMLSLLGGCSDAFDDPVVTDDSGLTDSSITELSTTVGTSWENAQATNITLSAEGNWDSGEISDPVVIKKGTTYMMWYSGKGSNDEIWRIGYATSTDGVTWTKYTNNPVLTPYTSTSSSLDYNGVKLSAVIYDEDEELYKVWYTGWNETTGSYSLFLAMSKYPQKGWYKYPNLSTDTSEPPEAMMTLRTSSSSVTIDNCIRMGIGSLSVMKTSYYIDSAVNYIYRYWVTTLDSNGAPYIQAGVSDDEVTWESNLELLDVLVDSSRSSHFYAEGYMMPSVIKDLYNGKYIYKMWFMNYAADTSTAFEGGLAYSSTGGTSFLYYDTTKYASILAAKAIDEDQKNIYRPCVIRDSTVYKMWYVGVDDTGNTYTICYRESRA